MARKKTTKGKKKTATAKKSNPKKSAKKSIKKSLKKTGKKASIKRKAKQVSAIPKGYHSITPYLIVTNAARAIDFYKKVFEAQEALRMDQPDGKIGHAELIIGDAKIMLADEYPEMHARAPHAYGGSPVGIHLYIRNVDGVVARAVHAGAKLLRPVETMFYGDRSGSIEDPFGHKWYISTHVEDVTPAQIKKRAGELFGKKS